MCSEAFREEARNRGKRLRLAENQTTFDRKDRSAHW